MPYLGSEPAQSALVAGDIASDAVTTIKIVDDAITSAKIVGDAVTLAKMAGGTDGNIISYDASGDPVAIATGTDGQVLTSTGAGSPPAFEAAAAGGFTQGTEQATTSGTSITFGSIPSGVDMIVISFFGVSFSAAVPFDITIGDAGGLETSGYVSEGNKSNELPGTGVTAEFTIGRVGDIDNNTFSGHVFLTLQDSANFTWICTGQMTPASGQDATILGSGSKSLSAELTQVSIHGGTFDAGAINIMYM